MKTTKRNADESRLYEVQDEIRDLDKKTGKTAEEKARLSELRDEQTKLKNRLTIYDSQLLRLEDAKPLRDLVNRSKEQARKKTAERMINLYVFIFFSQRIDKTAVS